MKQSTGSAVDRVSELEREHQILDERLRILVRRAYLTPSEQQEASELKRRKLFAKDRLFALRAR
ncbi:MAG TPA: DUF465 domain-containing protein [Polyangiaceae bacterium]|jgi:hypothetical protein|nr:DUF465 domain-containing protein [Polyangiaceae bacterium]